jgi:tetratricopeptide (TPR) repeat protein
VPAHRHGQLSAARADYEEILRCAPGHFDALHLLGVIALQQKRTQEGIVDEALESCDRAIALDPSYALAWSGRAGALRRLGRLEGAPTIFDRALALRPAHSIDHVSRGQLL